MSEETDDVMILEDQATDDMMSSSPTEQYNELPEPVNIPLEDPTTEDTDEELFHAVSEEVNRIVVMASEEDPSVKFLALREMRRLLSDENPPIDDFISCGIIPVLMDCLVSDDEKLCLEGAWGITKISVGTTARVEAVVNAGAIPLLLNLLSSGNVRLCEQAIWAIANIIGEGPNFQEFCLNHGVLPLLLHFMTDEISDNFWRNVIWIFVSLCRAKNGPPTAEASKLILPPLAWLLRHHNDRDVLGDAVWALSYLIDLGSEQIQMVIDSGIVPLLIPLITHKAKMVQRATLRAIGNIVTGTEEQTQCVIDCGALQGIAEILTYNDDSINEDTMWVLSNITAGNHLQVQAVFNAGLMPSIIDLLAKATSKTQREAAWATSNAILGGRPDHIVKMVDFGVIRPLCNLLCCDKEELIKLALESLTGILEMYGEDIATVCAQIEECGGLKKIEELQSHESEEIFKLCYDIICVYFKSKIDNRGASEEEEEGDAMQFESNNLYHQTDAAYVK